MRQGGDIIYKMGCSSFWIDVNQARHVMGPSINTV